MWDLAFSKCRRAWFNFLFGRTLQILSFNFLNVCIYRNWLWQLSPSIPLTGFFHCLRKASHEFSRRSQHLESFLARQLLVMQFSWFSLLQWVVMINLDFTTGDYCWQKNHHRVSRCTGKFRHTCFFGRWEFSAASFRRHFCSQVLWWRHYRRCFNFYCGPQCTCEGLRSSQISAWYLYFVSIVTACLLAAATPVAKALLTAPKTTDPASKLS